MSENKQDISHWSLARSMWLCNKKHSEDSQTYSCSRVWLENEY